MQSSFSELEYAAKKKQTRRDRFLAEIDAVTPWVELERAVTPFYPSSGGRGRPPIGLSRMLRMYVAQQCFGLSDEGIEDALYDSQAILDGLAIIERVFDPFVRESEALLRNVHPQHPRQTNRRPPPTTAARVKRGDGSFQFHPRRDRVNLGQE